MGTRLSGGRARRPGLTAAARLDVDRVLSSQYLAAVARELQARGLPVDAAVLHDRACGGGRVIFALPADHPADRPLPLYARWDGGRRWTLLIGFPAGAERTCRTSLRLPHLPAPVEAAEFVAGAVPGVIAVRVADHPLTLSTGDLRRHRRRTSAPCPPRPAQTRLDSGFPAAVHGRSIR